MPKCSNCGAELNAGAKFCEECGTPVPQTKTCPKCGVQLKPEAKFCSECGYSFAAQSAPSTKAGVSVGDKNVIAGDVVGEAYKIHGNATFVKNEDETKKMVRCHVCGRNIPITESITCVKCGEHTCEVCMDMRVKSCQVCVESAAREQDDVYRQAVIHVLEDGMITLVERRELKALQKQLGISDARVEEIEDRVRSDSAFVQVQAPLSKCEKLELENAKEMFYGNEEDDVFSPVEMAFITVEPIYKRHPDNEEVVSLYVDLLINKDPDEARKYLDSFRVDILGVKIAGIDLAFKDGDFADVETRLGAAERLWPDSVRLQCRRIAFYLIMYMRSDDKTYLDRARSVAESIAEGETKLERSEVESALRAVMKASGEKFEELTQEECDERGLYFRTASESLDDKQDDPFAGFMEGEESNEDDSADSDENGNNDFIEESDEDDSDGSDNEVAVDFDAIVDYIKSFKESTACDDIVLPDESSFAKKWSNLTTVLEDSYDVSLDPDDAIAIIDCTVFGSAKNGVLIDKTGIYPNNDGDDLNGWLDWNDVKNDANVKKRGSYEVILYDDEDMVKGIDVAGSDLSQFDALRFFKGLLALVRGEEL